MWPWLIVIAAWSFVGIIVSSWLDRDGWLFLFFITVLVAVAFISGVVLSVEYLQSEQVWPFQLR